MLEARELECERGGRTLFRGLALALRAGDVVRVAGPNGSGKTSLLRILCGLLSPTSGTVQWRGEAIGSCRDDYARHLVYLGHAPAVKDELTAAENLRIACSLAGRGASTQDMSHALQRFGVPEGVVGKLSQGQRRRAALARLLLSGSAPLWFLDEPFTALDAAAADLTKKAVLEQAGRGGAVVYTTHQDAGLQDSRVIEL